MGPVWLVDAQDLVGGEVGELHSRYAVEGSLGLGPTAPDGRVVDRGEEGVYDGVGVAGVDEGAAEGDVAHWLVGEAFFSGLQRELLDQHDWATRDQLALALYAWIETWYNPQRRHSYNNGLSPTDYEAAHAA